MYTYRETVMYRGQAGHGWSYAAYPESIAYEVAHFVERCILRGEPPRSTLQDAADAQRIIEAAEESVRTGCTVELAWPAG